MEVTGADGVMIGRGAQGNPWIFRRLTHYLATGEELPPPTMQERARVIMRHLDLLLKYKGEYIAMRQARKLVMGYFKGLRGAASLRNDAGKLEPGMGEHRHGEGRFPQPG